MKKNIFVSFVTLLLISTIGSFAANAAPTTESQLQAKYGNLIKNYPLDNSYSNDISNFGNTVFKSSKATVLNRYNKVVDTYVAKKSLTAAEGTGVKALFAKNIVKDPAGYNKVWSDAVTNLSSVIKDQKIVVSLSHDIFIASLDLYSAAVTTLSKSISPESAKLFNSLITSSKNNPNNAIYPITPVSNCLDKNSCLVAVSFTDGSKTYGIYYFIIANQPPPAPATSNKVTTPAPVTSSKVTTPAPVTSSKVTTPAPVTSSKVNTPAPVASSKVTTQAPVTSSKVTTPAPSTNKKPIPKPSATPTPTPSVTPTPTPTPSSSSQAVESKPKKAKTVTSKSSSKKSAKPKEVKIDYNKIINLVNTATTKALSDGYQLKYKPVDVVNPSSDYQIEYSGGLYHFSTNDPMEEFYYNDGELILPIKYIKSIIAVAPSSTSINPNSSVDYMKFTSKSYSSEKISEDDKYVKIFLPSLKMAVKLPTLAKLAPLPKSVVKSTLEKSPLFNTLTLTLKGGGSEIVTYDSSNKILSIELSNDNYDNILTYDYSTSLTLPTASSDGDAWFTTL